MPARAAWPPRSASWFRGRDSVRLMHPRYRRLVIPAILVALILVVLLAAVV